MKKQLEAIIFDLGGVVLSRGLWLFREYLVKNYSVTNEETLNIFIKKYYKPYFSGILSEEKFWLGILEDLKISANWKELKKILLDFYFPQKGVFELIEKLRKNGYKTYLLSDQTNDWWPILDQRYGISNYFDKVFISSEVGFNKPEKEFYEFVLKDTKIKPDEILFIDDLKENLGPAEELGMNTLFYLNTPMLKRELKDLYGIST